eukprot:10770843-Lingulodinium_polyedra.AAC.1
MRPGMSCSSARRGWPLPESGTARSCHTPSPSRGANSGSGPYSCCHSASASAAFHRWPEEA